MVYKHWNVTEVCKLSEKKKKKKSQQYSHPAPVYMNIAEQNKHNIGGHYLALRPNGIYKIDANKQRNSEFMTKRLGVCAQGKLKKDSLL